MDQYQLSNGLVYNREELEKVILEVKELLKPNSNCSAWLITYFGDVDFDKKALREKIMEKVKNLEDLVFLVTIALYQKNNISKIIKKVANELFCTRLLSLKEVLKIKRKTSYRHLTVTLHRIGIVFPEVIAIILHLDPEAPGPIDYKRLREAAEYEYYPSIARYPSLACLLPVDVADTSLILNVFFLCRTLISKSLPSKKRIGLHKLTAEEKACRSKSSQREALVDPILTNTEREEWCKIFNIRTDDCYSDVWMTAAVNAKRKLVLDYYEVSF